MIVCKNKLTIIQHHYLESQYERKCIDLLCCQDQSTLELGTSWEQRPRLMCYTSPQTFWLCWFWASNGCFCSIWWITQSVSTYITSLGRRGCKLQLDFYTKAYSHEVEMLVFRQIPKVRASLSLHLQLSNHSKLTHYSLQEFSSRYT